MQDLLADAEAIRSWFHEHARPLLESVHPEKVGEMDKELTRLVEVSRLLPQELPVCFLGNSGVGKSTLINAVVGGSTTVLPSGGIGPLTAQALTVHHAAAPSFEVQYHPLKNFWQLIFGLEQSHRQDFPSKSAGTDLESELESSADDEDLPEPSEESEPASARASALRKQAQLLITGNQDQTTPLHDLSDSLREAGGKPRIHGTQAPDADRERIREIQRALDHARNGRSLVRSGSGDETSFLLQLRDHASGFLAPLIKDLTVHWNSDVLAGGVALVDLPGVGISGDVYREVTRRWIREKAQAVVLVVDHRGITESVAELLRKSEFLNRLIYSADDPTNDPVLMVAVVKVDDIADSLRSQDKSRLKREYFADVCEKTIPTIRSQVRQQLEAVWSNEGEISETRQQVLNNILDTLQVHPLSAIEYRKALDADEDAPSFLKSLDESNVPRFQASLQELARRRREARLARRSEIRTRFLDRVLTTLRVVREQWEKDSRASEEAAKLREELLSFMGPLSKELHVRQGQFRAFLKKTIPSRISDLVAAANGKAVIEINRYLGRLGASHWATLRASVRRDGRFKGATDIDVPREFALRVEEPIAEAWSKKILADIRRETKQYGEDCLKLVGQVVEWARSQGARVKPTLVEAQYDSVKADAANLDSVGREMVNELREEAKNQLIDAIDPVIRDGCRKFVKRNADIGAGVRNRILELYRELAQTVAEAVEKPATAILTRLFREVEKQIMTAFESHQDPLETAGEAIVASQEEYRRRSDDQKRKSVLERVQAVFDSLPVEIHAEGSA